MDSLNPVSVGQLLTLSFSITNQGSASASDVMLVATLSSNVTYFSGSASQGGVTHSNGVVISSLGSLDVGAAATVNVVVTPGAAGGITNSVVVSENETDQNPSDNSATQSTLVVPLTFYPGASMTQARYYHSATLLPDGKVLIVGGQNSTGNLNTAELYDPTLRTFTPTAGSLPRAMYGHTATLLQDGTVLLAGGINTERDAVLYNPTNGTFSSLNSMLFYHSGHSATRLDDGRVLVSGGSGNMAEAELYLPASQSFVATGSRITGSVGHRAFLLTNGTVAMLGGAWINNLPPTNDLYVPSLGAFVSLGTINAQNGAGGEVLLDGNILLAGGFVQSSLSTSATIFHPATSNFTATGSSKYPHPRATATRLADGTVLVVGSDHLYTINEAAQGTPELYDPASGTFTTTAPLATRRQDHTATLLPDGTVLITGGRYFDFNIGAYGGYVILASTEIYDHVHTRRPPLVSMGNITIFEGDSGTTNALLPLTLSAPVGLPVSVTLWGTSTVLTFPPGVTNIYYPVAIEGNRDFGPDQVLGFGIRNPINAALGEDRGTVTILNDDPPPTVSVAPAAIGEGNVGTNSITLSVLLSAASTDPISVDFYTGDGTALAGSDYFATNGMLTFDPGITNLSVEVRLRPDIVTEPDEIFYLNVINATNALIATNQFPVTILNDDGLPGNIHHLELSAVASPQHEQTPFPLTIIARDAGGQVATNFNGGVTVWATLTNAPWLAFDFEEGDFSQWTPLNLGNTPGPYEMSLFDVAGHGVPSLAFRLLANAGAADGITRPITLLGGTLYFLSMDLAAWNENDGFGNGDPGTAHVLLGGQEIGTFGFGVFGSIIHSGETFRTNLLLAYTAPSNGTYQLSLRFDRGYGQANVWNYADNVRISPARLTPVWLAPFTNGVWSGNFQIKTNASGLSLLAEDGEGHRGEGNIFDVETTANLALQVTNAPASARAGADVTFTLSVSNRGPSTATAVVISNVLAGDWTFRSAAVTQGTVVTNDGMVLASVGTMTNGRSVTLTVTARPHTIGALTNVASVSSAVFDPDPANNTVLTVVTAAPPLLRVDNLSFTEGDAGTNFAQVVVWQDGLVGQTLSLDYATANGTAQAGTDYIAAAGTLVIPPDVVTQFISIPILGDVMDEPNRSFTLQLSNPTNATLNAASATVTIVDNDPLPAVYIADASVVEGNSGTTSMVFNVTLANPSSTTVQITCTTTNGTAVAGIDYVSTTTALSFPSGTTNQTFTVQVFGDANNEVDQTFLVNLSSPVNCSIARGAATGTIINDDAASGKLISFGFDPIASPQFKGCAFPVTVRALDHLGQPASFSGSVTLAARTDGYYIRRLLDDFEDGDLKGWTNYGTASLVATNVNDVAANASRSLRLSGKASNPFYSYSLRYTITNSRPNKVSFFVRSAQTNAICGRMWAVGGPGYRAFDFYMNKDGRMGLYNNTTALATMPYTSNRWYRVDMDLTWGSTYSARKVSCSVDGVVLTNNLNFLDDTYSGLDWIAVQNTEVSTSWFDDIHVYESFYTNLVVTPATLSGFSGGVWTGNVTLSQPAPNVYITVTDNNDHAGRSTNFDVAIAPMQLVTPAAVTEGSAPVAAEVRIPVMFAQPLTVFLTSSVPAELTVPASVTIPAGQTNASFNLTVIDDALIDGSQLVNLYAGNTNLLSTTNVVSVDDNETAVLSLSVPTNLLENAGTLVGQGRVSVSATVAKSTTVTLVSSDTNVVQVPASVTISVGQSNANFNVAIVDDARLDGDQAATITASVPSWTGDSKIILVTDNEDTLLRLSGPAQVSEEAGLVAYTARISGSLTTNLTLAFASDNTNAFIVPDSAVIPAGQTSVDFMATVVDNAVFDGAKLVALSINAPGFVGVTNTVTVLDNEIHHFGFAPVSGTKTSSVPFAVTITARDILDGPATAFNGLVLLTATGPGAPPLLQPTNVALANGSWSGAVTLFTADSPITLHAASTNGLNGQSSSFQVSTSPYFTTNIGGGDLVYSPISERIWVLASGSSTLVPVDPFRSLVEPAVSAGPGAGRIVTSGDGRYLHIVGNSGLEVRRFDTLTRAVDLSWTNGGLSVEDIAAQPGHPNVVAVSWACPGCSPRGRGVTLYEGGVARSNVWGVNTIEFGELPDRLYGYNNDVYGVSFRTAHVDASGLVDEGTLPIMGGWSDSFMISGGTLFSQSAGAFDPDTAIMFTSANGWWGGQGDKASGRFFTVGYFTIGPVTAYDMATMLPVGSINIPGPYNVGALIRWSTNGLAFTAGGKLVVMRSALLPSAPGTDLAVATAQTNLFVQTSNTVHCPLTITNAGPNPASNAVLAVLLPENVTLAGMTCADGIVQTQSVHSAVCVVTNLPVGSSAVVDLTLLGSVPGASSARVSLTGDNADLNRTNNSLVVNFQVGYAFPPDSIVELHQSSLDLAWNSNAGRIVISAHNVSLNAGSSLLLVDPLTGRFDAPIPVGRGPNRLSIHPAGRYLYASLDGESAITRVDLASGAADLKFTPTRSATDVAVKPDDPDTVVATGAGWPQLVVYHNGSPLPNTVDPGAYLWDRYIEFSTLSPNLLYLAEVDGFTRVQIGANGATVLNGLGGMISGYDRDMRCSGGRVFTAGGRVFDPETPAFISTVPYSGLVAPDSTCGRVFYLTGSGSTYTLTSLNFTNLQFAGSLTISNISGTPTSLIRWGVDGLAFRTSGGQIFLLRTTLADDRDNDGLPDSWEQQYFASYGASDSGPADDPDGDGITNLQEMRNGLNPVIYDAVRLLTEQRSTNGSFQLTALVRPLQNYVLFASTNLHDWVPLTNFNGTNLTVSFMDQDAGTFPLRFYRLGPQSDIPAPSLGFGVTPLVDNGVNLLLNGFAGVSYRLQSSSNLMDWFTVTNVTSTNGLMPLWDPAAPNDACRFYRVVIP